MRATAKPLYLTLRIMPQEPPTIPPMTEAEMRAYCRAWDIPVTGKALHRPEVRTVPHPRCAYRSLPIARTGTHCLRGQLAAV